LIKDRLSGGASRLAALLPPQMLPVFSVVAALRSRRRAPESSPCSMWTDYQRSIPTGCATLLASRLLPRGYNEIAVGIQIAVVNMRVRRAFGVGLAWFERDLNVVR